MADSKEPVKVGVREFRGKLGDYLRRARAGSRFVIVSRGQPIAEVRAPAADSEKAKAPSILGALKGQIWIADDFDEWPEGFLDVMEGKDEHF